MFNDRYVLTQAMIEGRKTITRRIEGGAQFQEMAQCADHIFYNEDTGLIDFMYEGIDIFNHKPRYKVGEIVAVAQSYFKVRNFIVGEDFDLNLCDAYEIDDVSDVVDLAGWNNKMFVRADLMPHQIRITSVRCERLQDISDEDCMKEGLFINEYTYHNEKRVHYGYDGFLNGKEGWFAKGWFNTPREAFASLIDKVSGRDTWKRNPWVFVYEFELVK